MADENKNTSLSLGKLNTPSDYLRKFKEVESDSWRKKMEGKWKENLSFYKGDQYVYWNGQTLERLITDELRLPKSRVRLVSNQIAPGVQSLAAKLTKTRPVFTAAPNTSSSRSVKAAQMAEKLFEFWWDDMDLTNKEEEALIWSINAGQGWWLIEWDKFAGKALKVVLDPNGQPILNESLETMYSAMLQQQGGTLDAHTVYTGDITVSCPSPFDVFVDNTAKVFEDCKFAFVRHRMDPDEAEARWGVKLEPDSVATPPEQSLMPGASNAKNLTTVVCGYFRPNAANPEGRYVVCAEGKKDFLEDYKWSEVYPFHELPLIKFPGFRIPGSVYDDAVVGQAVPIQKELNRTLSQIVEYKNLTVTPQWIAPVGSMTDSDMSNEPGKLYEFVPMGQNLIPQAITPAPIPSYVFNHLENISGRLNDVFSIVDVTEGKLPPNLEAGVAIDLLQEMASDRFAPMLRLIESALERAGKIMLSYAQKYYDEPRMVRIRGLSGASQIKEFTKSDIEGGTINVEAGSGLPRTRAGQEMRIMRLVDANIIPPQSVYKYLDIADVGSLKAKFEADEDQAQRGIDAILEGRPVSEDNMALAQQTIAQGVNPDTGQPFETQEEVMAFMQTQMFTPPMTANLDVWLDIVGTYMKSVDFEGLPIPVRHNFSSLYDNIMKSIQSKPQPTQPGEPPKVTMQIKGTAGPTAAARILQEAGLQDITPQIMTEKPLETWVTDSADKPNVQETGNMPADPNADMINQANVMMKMSQAEQMHKHAEDNASLQTVHGAQKAEANSIDIAHKHSKLREQLAKEVVAKRKAREKNSTP